MYCCSKIETILQRAAGCVMVVRLTERSIIERVEQEEEKKGN